MNPLLERVRVLDLSRLLPGPFCTQYLAQLGADVIKIEEPGGEYGRQTPEFFQLLNRGKRSLVLDLKRPADLDAFKQLVAGADLVVESFRPGVMARLGCGYEDLRTRNPGLVYAALTGYGQSGPYRDRAGHDMNYLAYAGAIDQTGASEGPPVLSNLQIADVAGGALTCALAIVSALFGARASGEGTLVDCAMLDGALALNVASIAAVRALGASRPRGCDMLSGGLPNYSLYEASDGKYVAVGALEPKFFARLCEALGRSELAALSMSAFEPARIRAELAATFKTRTRDEWESALAGADCCVCGVFTPEEALRNPQVAARGLWTTDPAGKPAFLLPVRFSNARTRGGMAPEIGAHSAAVWTERDERS